MAGDTSWLEVLLGSLLQVKCRETLMLSRERRNLIHGSSSPAKAPLMVCNLPGGQEEERSNERMSFPSKPGNLSDPGFQQLIRSAAHSRAPHQPSPSLLGHQGTAGAGSDWGIPALQPLLPAVG